jgi:hypothetical protein
MKKSILFSRYIWLVGLFVLGSLLHVSCEGCKPQSTPKDKDVEPARINFKKLAPIFYIKKATDTKVIVGAMVNGTVTEKHFPDAKLWLLVIPQVEKAKPQVEEVKKAIEAFQQEGNPDLDYDNEEVRRIPIALKLGEGAAFCIRELPGPEQGSFQDFVLIDGLPSGSSNTGSYNAYLLLRARGFGTVFSNHKHIKIPVSDPADPSISMVDAKVEKEAQNNIKVVAQASITNHAPHVQGGYFLFIKQGVSDSSDSVEAILADVLKAGKGLPVDAKFTRVANEKASIYPILKPVLGANNIKVVVDPTSSKFFEVGATYQGYSCVHYTKHGKDWYVVSQPVAISVSSQ